ncbi:hypothetical protein Ciccas_004532 [Cichlidogyrus casuarinus]|uniref:Uncharacterized protein n=1 Tax=Cichlidogyrus casuarinus TaxID=1844966 RepID=A0ABD2QB86_9PLAT
MSLNEQSSYASIQAAPVATATGAPVAAPVNYQRHQRQQLLPRPRYDRRIQLPPYNNSSHSHSLSQRRRLPIILPNHLYPTTSSESEDVIQPLDLLPFRNNVHEEFFRRLIISTEETTTSPNPGQEEEEEQNIVDHREEEEVLDGEEEDDEDEDDDQSITNSEVVAVEEDEVHSLFFNPSELNNSFGPTESAGVPPPDIVAGATQNNNSDQQPKIRRCSFPQLSTVEIERVPRSSSSISTHMIEENVSPDRAVLGSSETVDVAIAPMTERYLEGVPSERNSPLILSRRPSGNNSPHFSSRGSIHQLIFTNFAEMENATLAANETRSDGEGEEEGDDFYSGPVTQEVLTEEQGTAPPGSMQPSS